MESSHVVVGNQSEKREIIKMEMDKRWKVGSS